jgi:hypothetical protein
MITRIVTGSPDGFGSIYHQAFSVTADSDPVILPYRCIASIAAVQTGTGGLYFTNDPEDVIKAGEADFVAWDGSSAINPAMTGFYVKVTSGTVTAKITVRTYN